MKDQLAQIFEKYPFVHLDKSGELSIIVPLTGAASISDNFTADETNPIFLYLFGDNTCKSDLERRTFFCGKQKPGSHHSTKPFTELFSNLIQELNSLKSSTEITVDEQLFLKTIIVNLNELKEQALVFRKGNPGYEDMKNDFNHSDEIMVSKSEFLVTVYPDRVRQFDLPNVMSLINPNESGYKQLLAQSNINQCLEALSHVQKSVAEDSLNSIADALGKLDSDPIDYLCKKDNKDPKALFKAVYEILQKQDTSLENQQSAVFEVMESNLVAAFGENENYSTWKKEEVVDAIKSIFKQANLLSGQSGTKQKTFADVYNQSFDKYKESTNDDSESGCKRRNTYQLFILQTFLYLCSLQLRLKNKESAKKFLSLFEDRDTLNNLVLQLCTDEQAFMRMMADEFELSSAEYASIAESAYGIVLAHIDAEHFDELRIACSAQLLHDSNYIVMGGRLCWSTSPINEEGNIRSLEQQKKISSANFEIFYNQRQFYIDKSRESQQIKVLLDKDMNDEGIAEVFVSKIRYLTKYQKSQILSEAIQKNKYEHAKLLIENYANLVFPTVFISVIKSTPVHTDLIRAFLKADSRHAVNIDGNDLIQAAKKGDFELVKIIIEHRPDLLESKDSFQQTPLLWACANGYVDIVEYLMDSGADIHVRTKVSQNHRYKIGEAPTGGRAALDWARCHDKIDPVKASKMIALFDTYYQRMEENFKTNTAYKDQFNKAHLTQAVNNGDLKLIALFLKYCPHLEKDFTQDDQIRAKQQHHQQMLRSQIMPYQNSFNKLLDELQRKAELLSKKYGSIHEASKVMQGLINDLSTVRNDFFMNEITPQSFKKFERNCKQALKDASPVLSTHRGWHGYPDFVRRIIGVIATLAVIPALVVHFSSTKGYVGVFFSSKENVKTDSSEKMDEFANNLETLKTEISNKLA
ncbi:TPA: ankyrin repeat domain-containing protein [Legionella pneumophila]|nr:ankyrin repeat domain-containing protein [Legionella pneumophila]HAT8182070.1 ankyrin repeat domain-containing protein [Legionella pneumophila]